MKIAIDIDRSTGTCSAARASSGRSRRSRVPFVSTDSGVPLSASAVTMPGMSAYRPSARWYGSVLVPSATSSRRHDRRAGRDAPRRVEGHGCPRHELGPRQRQRQIYLVEQHITQE